MNPGLKILIERVQEFPQDFESSYTWTRLLQEARDLCDKGVFPAEDVEVLNEAIKTLAVKKFEARVMDALNHKPAIDQTEGMYQFPQGVQQPEISKYATRPYNNIIDAKTRI